jgi:hypothetical protein
MPLISGSLLSESHEIHKKNTCDQNAKLFSVQAGGAYSSHWALNS